MHDCIDLREFKSVWLEKISSMKKIISEIPFELLPQVDSVDIGVDDLINPPKDEKIEQEICRITEKWKDNERLSWDEKRKKEEIKNCHSDLDFVKKVQENLDTIRSEPLNISVLIKDEHISDADTLERELENLSLHYFKDIDQKAKLRPIEKNYIADPFKILKEKQGANLEEESEIAFDDFTFNTNSNNELMLNVSVYHSYTGKKVQEFVVLGSQTLTDLKDNIYCICDQLVYENDPSSFFFIDRTFYNDMRTPDCIDLSKEIIDNQKKKIKTNHDNEDINSMYFSTKRMDEVKFEDLIISLGKPCIYRHRKSCDHIFIFNDVRLRDKDDIASRNQYPIRIYQGKIKRKKCDGCYLNFAKIICHNDRIQTEDPSYFCNECYHNIHFDENNDQKIKNFQARLYIHD